jgi:hypothetical protein
LLASPGESAFAGELFPAVRNNRGHVVNCPVDRDFDFDELGGSGVNQYRA